ILCWRHRGVGAGMYSPLAALSAIAGAVASGACLYLLIDRQGEGWESDGLFIISTSMLGAYIFLAGASIFVWAAGRRWGRRRHSKQAGPPAQIYASFEQAFEARFGRAKGKAWLSRGHVAGTIVVLGWGFLATPLVTPSRPG